VLNTLLSPVVLFFALGALAALLRSPMSVPQSFAKGLAIYLMMAIGLKGGVEMSQTALSGQVLAVFGAAIILSFGLPLIAYAALRKTSGLSKVDAAATAGHYGSISIVTFVAAIEALRIAGLPSSGYLVAIAAIMETPAIITALWLAMRGRSKSSDEPALDRGELGTLLSLPPADVALLMVLCASASYIAVPAAMRLALPESDPSVYLTLSLGVTFPFNIAIGIPLYIACASWIAGAVA